MGLTDHGSDGITICTWCNHGRHRSVAMAELLFRCSPPFAQAESSSCVHYTQMRKASWCTCVWCRAETAYVANHDAFSRFWDTGV